MTDKLFTPLDAGAIHMKNRIVMAPLTRNRAKNDTPGVLQATYYAQRAGAGLIVSEGTPISPTAKGYADTPGIWSDEQVAQWQEVTKAVHDKGGKIVVQIWHVGRVSHESLIGGPPVAPSAITAQSRTFVGGEFLPTSEPRALETAEIAGILEDYARAARNAIRAGFDGVEIHAANGYLIDQFLRDTSNKRTDGYGGPIANRVRFLREVVAAVTGAIGADRTGIRLSPWSNANDVGIDSDTPALFAAVIDVLNEAGLAFLHVVEGQTGGPREWPQGGIEALRDRFKGVWIANNGYSRESAIEAVDSGAADAVAFGKLYISNPDLAERLEADLPLSPLPTQGLYGGGAEFYTDYPARAA
ncbi:alkene reductase [Tabrizicola sp. J26]|uniref:alkene reductase n=1 Tax=Alitabrizicola rongguiensis TaxID=2909234 RepID=UPI001F487142|nr:alkene reductase [Tabrizicola rongguiensis]MCF1708425.1 alkene reductase [Tabrizicola rongguiensis]